MLRYIEQEMMSIKNKRLLNAISILMTSLMLIGMPVYAAEEQPLQPEQQEQPAEEQQEQPAEEQPAQEEQQEQEQPAQPAAVIRRTTTSRVTTQQQQQDQEEENEEESEDEEGESTTESGKYTLTLNKNANVREGASTGSNSKIVAPFGLKLSSNEKVTNEIGETWYQVEYGGYTGYIRGDMADVIEESTPEEDEEGEEAQEEDEAEIEEAAEEITTMPVAVNTMHIPKSVDKATSSKVTTYSYSDTGEKVESRKGVDLVFILFVGVAVIGCFLSFLMYTSMRAEYKRYKKNKLSKERNI